MTPAPSDSTTYRPRPAFPRPATLLGITDHDFHQAGIDRRRARVLRMAARHADRLERLDELSAAAAERWLLRLPGVGRWTAAITTSIASGTRVEVLSALARPP